MFAPNISGDRVQDTLESIVTMNFLQLLQFQQKSNCVGFDLLKRQPERKSANIPQVKRKLTILYLRDDKPHHHQGLKVDVS
jgi:hypothetical protein